ncbi:hypothetical protein GCM10010255_28890 [Streptomyces coeruleofuscus]|uniref:Transposase n=1 Tax=Streptomyces coeruleofuscus TaxID=66879 RepID=A0ABP5V7F7_9ACTN
MMGRSDRSRPEALYLLRDPFRERDARMWVSDELGLGPPLIATVSQMDTR